MGKIKSTTTPFAPDPKRRKGFEKALNFAAEFWVELYSRTMDLGVMQSIHETVQTMVALEKYDTAFDLLYSIFVFAPEEYGPEAIPPYDDADLVRYFVEGFMLVSPDLLDELEEEWEETIGPLLDEDG